MEPEPSKYRIHLSDLEASVRVDPEHVVEERDVTTRAELDDGTGYLPGDVRPFAV